VFVRILQYIILKGLNAEKNLPCNVIVDALSYFFERECIENATIELLYLNIIQSSSIEFSKSNERKDWEKLELERTSIDLKTTQTAEFYLKTLICEMEYISAIIPTSFSDSKNTSGKEKEERALCFFEFLCSAVKLNVISYKQSSAASFDTFKELFVESPLDEEIKQPLRRMIKNYKEAITIKNYSMTAILEKPETQHRDREYYQKKIKSNSKLITRADELHDDFDQWLREMLYV
jgi:hypothetical protein